MSPKRNTMYKQEVAKIIFTHASSEASPMQTLRREIRSCPELQQKLKSLTNKDKLHYYNAQQVQLLFEHFGVGIDG